MSRLQVSATLRDLVLRLNQLFDLGFFFFFFVISDIKFFRELAGDVLDQAWQASKELFEFLLAHQRVELPSFAAINDFPINCGFSSFEKCLRESLASFKLLDCLLPKH